MARRVKEEIDEFTNMDIDQLQAFISTTNQQLSDAKNKRNFVQQERDMINSLYLISKDEQKKIEDACEKEEIVMEHLENEHRNEINAFINKFRHLEYDQDIFINDSLPKNSKEALEKEEKIRADREEFFMNKKNNLKRSSVFIAITGYIKEIDNYYISVENFDYFLYQILIFD